LRIWLSGLLFALSHSLLASHRCKQWAYRHGLHEPRYRLIYSVVATVATGAWIYYVHQLPDMLLYQSHGLIQALMISVQVLGLIVILAAFQPIDGLAFLGLKKADEEGNSLIEHGIYRHLRHPMYSGVMLFLLARPELTWSGLNFALVICLYFITGSRFEEQRMATRHPDYLAYRKRVPAFIPHLLKVTCKNPEV